MSGSMRNGCRLPTHVLYLALMDCEIFAKLWTILWEEMLLWQHVVHCFSLFYCFGIIYSILFFPEVDTVHSPTFWCLQRCAVRLAFGFVNFVKVYYSWTQLNFFQVSTKILLLAVHLTQECALKYPIDEQTRRTAPCQPHRTQRTCRSNLPR